MATSSVDPDFTQVISEELLCPVCLEELKEPKFLACAHNVCKECLEHIASRSRKEIKCPICRRSIVIPEGGVTCLPTNAVLVRLVEATLGRKAKIEIQKSLERGKPIVKLMAKKISDIDKALTDMAINVDRVEKNIHEKADQLIDVIRKHEASLCSEVEEFYGRKQGIIKHQNSNLCKLHSDTLNRVQDAETILKHGWSDPKKISDIATALVLQLKEVTELNLEESVDMSTFDENLELCMNAEATCNSILQGETFGKVTRKFLNTNSISSNVSCDLSNIADSTVTSSSPGRKMAAKKHLESEVLHVPLRSTSKGNHKTTDGYCKDTCILCNNKATHYCQVCIKLCCKDCIGRVIILSCFGYTEHHRIVEGHPTLSNQEKHLSSNEQDHNVCSFCGGIPSHKCIYCSKHSCGTCFSRYKTDPCSSGIPSGHHFVNHQSQKVTRDKDEMATSKEQTTPIVMDNHPHINEQNICDFCGLAATLLCKDCLKPICYMCRYVYKQDLCPPTKREHQFENIVAQPSKIDETAAKGSDTPWECKCCTFVNAPNHRICSMCATSVKCVFVHLA